jgi:hypothetical protein
MNQQLDNFFGDWVKRMERLRRDRDDEIFLDLMRRLERLRDEREFENWSPI